MMEERNKCFYFFNIFFDVVFFDVFLYSSSSLHSFVIALMKKKKKKMKCDEIEVDFVLLLLMLLNMLEQIKHFFFLEKK
jgi:hypothetical protein